MRRLILCVAVLVCAVGQAEASAIIGVSIPVNSQNDLCRPVLDDVWSVGTLSQPMDVNLGIGNLINPDESFVPMVVESFSMHEHNFDGQPDILIAPHTPDPTRAVVTYTFDSPTVVDQLEIIQHTNGITRVEGFVGESVDSLTSIGSIFGPDGDATGAFHFAETQSYVFDFNNATAGSIFQFVIRKTSIDVGYAAYRAFPLDSDGARYAAAAGEVPEPSTLIIWSLLGATFLAVGYFKKRRQAA